MSVGMRVCDSWCLRDLVAKKYNHKNTYLFATADKDTKKYTKSNTLNYSL